MADCDCKAHLHLKFLGLLNTADWVLDEILHVRRLQNTTVGCLFVAGGSS
jgi:hypothetical protein